LCRYAPGCRAPGGDVKLVVCEADGVTWSAPRLVYGYAEGRINKVIANKLVVTSSGAWVLPFWRELGPCRSTAQAEPTAGVLVSKVGLHTSHSVDTHSSKAAWFLQPLRL
jgi:hypothetical protein